MACPSSREEARTALRRAAQSLGLREPVPPRAERCSPRSPGRSPHSPQQSALIYGRTLHHPERAHGRVCGRREIPSSGRLMPECPVTPAMCRDDPGEHPMRSELQPRECGGESGALPSNAQGGRGHTEPTLGLQTQHSTFEPNHPGMYRSPGPHGGSWGIM